MQGSFENNLVKSRNDQIQSLTEPVVEQGIALPSEKTVTVYNSLNLIYKEVWHDLDRQLLERLPVAKLDVSSLELPFPGGSNYVETVQNTKHGKRHRDIVTASRLPALLSFYGKATFIAGMEMDKEN